MSVDYITTAGNRKCLAKLHRSKNATVPVVK